MGLVAICKATLAELPDIVVNYDDWQNNIKGSRTDPLASLLTIAVGGVASLVVSS